MSKDISKTLEGWDYDPEGISVRIVQGDDGRDKIQLRLDLGLLQLEFEGRPDGRRVAGYDSWLDFYEQQQRKHAERDPDGPPFLLESEDCQRLIARGRAVLSPLRQLLALGALRVVRRDTTRNLRLFAFVRQYARHDKDKLQFDQWRPYVTMMHARAVATPLVELRDYRAAVGAIDAAIAGIRDFLREYDQLHAAENCSELDFLLRWREEIVSKTSGELREVPYNPLARLQVELEQAVSEERFEDAARLRDTIRRESRAPGDGSDAL